MLRSVFLIPLIILLLSGCATMFSKSSDTIMIKTEPPGAEVYLGVDLLGTTPLTHTFQRNTFEQKSLNIRKAGYKTRELSLGRTLEPVSLFNFGFFLTTGGATSWGIDALTGAMIRYDPSSYFIDLEPVDVKPESSDINLKNRILFVLLNYSSLKDDIAKRDGEYLYAYYETLRSPRDYDTFL